MITANTTIIAGGRIFRRGQAVTGLSPLDKKWMLAAGYVSVTEKKEESRKQKNRPAQGGMGTGEGDEFQGDV